MSIYFTRIYAHCMIPLERFWSFHKLNPYEMEDSILIEPTLVGVLVFALIIICGEQNIQGPNHKYLLYWAVDTLPDGNCTGKS